MIAGSIVVAMSLLCLAWVSEFMWRRWDWSEWTADLLLNLGAAVLLVAPIEWFGSLVRRDVARNDRRQTEAVDAVSRRVSDLNDQVLSLAELNDGVAAAAQRTRAADEDLFASLRSAPSREVVLRAVERAKQRKLVGEGGVRVPITRNAELRMRFTTESGAPPNLVVVLEAITGEERRRWSWDEQTSIQQLLERVADATDAEGEPRQLDVQFTFERLAATLEVAAANQWVRPVIEYFPPQWALTEDAIVCTSHGNYAVTHDRSDRVRMDAHVKGKTWLHEDSYEAAHEVASYLFPLTADQERFERERVLRARTSEFNWDEH